MPTRLEGQTFSIAGCVVTVGHDMRATNWKPFEVESGSAQTAPIIIRCRDNGRPAHAGPRQMPQALRRRDGNSVMLSIAGEDFSAEYDEAAFSVALNHSQPPGRYPIDAVTKFLIAHRSVGAGGLLLHGVCVASKGKAALFIGPSGAGKSTLARLCADEGLDVLADELVAVLPAGSSSFVAEGTPWNIGAPLRGSLRNVGLLAWGDAHRVETVPAADVLKLLLTNALLPYEDEQVRARMFNIAAELLKNVSPWRLTFALRPGVGSVIADALVKAE